MAKPYVIGIDMSCTNTINNIQYAVPNYLTRRQLNVRLSASF